MPHPLSRKFSLGFLLVIPFCALVLSITMRRKPDAMASPAPSVAVDETAPVATELPQPGADRISMIETEPGPTIAASAAPASDETAVVTGQLVDAESGAPVAGALVRWSAGHERQTTGANGRFTFDRAPVKYRFGIFVIKDDEYMREVVDVAIRRGTKTHDVGTIRLVRGDGRAEPARAKGESGIVHELRDGHAFVARVRPASAADQAGLRAGDRIVSIDGKSADGLGFTARSRLLDGDVDSSLTLVIETADGRQRTVVLKRRLPWEVARAGVQP